ncbi:hypothetical protein ACHAWC_011939 [Mediolabrus comicus]
MRTPSKPTDSDESIATTTSEVSPLLQRSGSTIIHNNNNRHNNKFAMIHISSLFIYIICMIIATALLFSHSNYYHQLSLVNRNNLNSNIEFDETHNNVRQDVVENNIPEKRSIVLTPPPMYLDTRKTSLLGRGRYHQQHNHVDTNNTKVASTSATQLRWGILGAGRIAHDFTSALVSSGCKVTAVATSNDYSRAKSFANAFDIPNYYGTYDDLAQDANVDIVYVATTNQNHLNPTMFMLQSGKNVLVEKPTAVTYKEAKRMYDEARERGLFLMTNHWTRFFPLVKYLRTTFLEQSKSSSSSATTIDMMGSSGPKKDKSSTSSLRWQPHSSQHHHLHQQHRQYNLGKVQAMHGDFGFKTPLDPHDRFLNRTLGGGVTLDVGCYLVELALLAAYDHHQSRTTTVGADVGVNDEGAKRKRRKLTSNELQPNGVTATGHGMYNGFEFPVDVESSFSIRWGGMNYGIWNGECDAIDNSEDENLAINERRGCPVTNGSTQASISGGNDDEFTMIASFQASFRRPSTFEVEYEFENGRVVLHGPGNCPNEMTIYENEPFGPLIRETTVSFKLPKVDLSPYGRSNYPRAEGFVYVIDRIEECMALEGIPGRAGDVNDSGCLELEENSIEEQLATVEITEKVLKEMNYFG